MVVDGGVDEELAVVINVAELVHQSVVHVVDVDFITFKAYFAEPHLTAVLWVVYGGNIVLLIKLDLRGGRAVVDECADILFHGVGE